jgi:hypothetical protein
MDLKKNRMVAIFSFSLSPSPFFSSLSLVPFCPLTFPFHLTPLHPSSSSLSPLPFSLASHPNRSDEADAAENVRFFVTNEKQETDKRGTPLTFFTQPTYVWLNLHIILSTSSQEYKKTGFPIKHIRTEWEKWCPGGDTTRATNGLELEPFFFKSYHHCFWLSFEYRSI